MVLSTQNRLYCAFRTKIYDKIETWDEVKEICTSWVCRCNAGVQCLWVMVLSGVQHSHPDRCPCPNKQCSPTTNATSREWYWENILSEFLPHTQTFVTFPTPSHTASPRHHSIPQHLSPSHPHPHTSHFRRPHSKCIHSCTKTQQFTVGLLQSYCF